MLEPAAPKATDFTAFGTIQDAVFALKPGDSGIGWHVDTKGFWPCYDSAPDEDARLEGVNVWITLSPLTATEGGGLAVAPGSARASWCEKARNIVVKLWLGFALEGL